MCTITFVVQSALTQRMKANFAVHKVFILKNSFGKKEKKDV